MEKVARSNGMFAGPDLRVIPVAVCLPDLGWRLSGSLCRPAGPGSAEPRGRFHCPLPVWLGALLTSLRALSRLPPPRGLS